MFHQKGNNRLRHPDIDAKRLESVNSPNAVTTIISEYICVRFCSLSKILLAIGEDD